MTLRVFPLPWNALWRVTLIAGADEAGDGDEAIAAAVTVDNEEDTAAATTVDTAAAMHQKGIEEGDEAIAAVMTGDTAATLPSKERRRRHIAQAAETVCIGNRESSGSK